MNFLRKLDITKATGLDGLSPKLLRLSANIISTSITKLINNCGINNTFPNSLKHAKVFPSFKTGDKSNPTNYRPISILPVTSKIFERHVVRHLLAFLNKYNLINEGQSGFRQLHSCQTALVKIIDNWLGNINAGELTGAIVFTTSGKHLI